MNSTDHNATSDEACTLLREVISHPITLPLEITYLVLISVSVVGNADLLVALHHTVTLSVGSPMLV